MPDPSDFGWDIKDGFDLTGKRALVVGTANPAGRSVALAFAEAGADVAVVSATLDGDEIMEAKRIAKDIVAMGRASIAQGWDVSLPTNVQVGLKQVQREFGKPTVVVYNGDAPFWKPITTTTDSEFARVMGVNLNGAFNVSRSFVKEFPEGDATGRIIYLNSIFGERGIDDASAYGAARAGVVGLMANLSQELGGRNFTVNCISSGWMDWTPGRGPEEIGQNRLLRFIPMRRFGHADELAGLAVLLASDGSGYLNGQVFHVDGGIMTHL